MSSRISELDSIIKMAIYKSGLSHQMKVADAAQAIWIKVLEKWSDVLDPARVPRALLYCFAYRRAQDLKRRTEPYTLEVVVEPSSLSEQIARLSEDPEPTPETYALVKEILDSLTEREKNVVYGLHVEGKSQVEVGKENNISRARVQQIEKSAIEKLRRESEHPPPSSGPRSTPSSPPPPPSSSRF